jgi:hypothetical protein
MNLSTSPDVVTIDAPAAALSSYVVVRGTGALMDRFRRGCLGIVLASWAFAAACSSSSVGPPPTGDAGPPSAGDDAGGDGDPLSPTERDTYDEGSGSVPSIEQLAHLAHSLFDFDPTIDPAKTAAENASAIANEVSGNLGESGVAGTTCGHVTLATTSVTVDFGGGCTMKNGVTASGSVTAAVASSSGTVTITLTFSSLVVNGASLAGSASFATSNGNTFAVDASVTTGKSTYKVTNLTMGGSSNGTITINGAVTTGGGDLTTTMTFTQVSWKLGDCYPSAGSLSTKKALVTTTVTFDAATPTTGQVTVTVGKRTSTQTLPAYGKCGSKDGGA